MNKMWKNEKLLAAQAGCLPATRRSKAKFRRNYRSVEKRGLNIWVHSIRNASDRCGYRFLPSDIPYGNDEFTKMEYAGNMIYEDNALKRILIDGGYIENGVYYYYVTDHQGNNRLVVNSGGTVVQKNHYYPFGTTFAETAVAEQGVQPYKYNGKGLDQMHGLNLYDYGARYYESALGRFTTMDPLAEKYYSISPYAYCANKTGKVTEDYRKDGSIIYSNEASGYKRMWNNTQKTGNEEMGVITDKGVLVLPSWNNGKKDSKIEEYGYAFDKGKLADPVSDKKTPFSGTVHTHPTLETVSGVVNHSWMHPSQEDYDYFKEHTPNIPFYVITADGIVHGRISLSSEGTNSVNLGRKTRYIEDIIFGNYSLKNRKK
jgi:RHS repeat-associated protein